MGAKGENEGFQVLDELDCQAINKPPIPKATAARQAQNERMRVDEEFVIDMSPARESGQDDNA